jgi:aspartate kinase
MKFGGTSVEDAEAIRRLIEIVRSRLPLRLVVVVSALAGATDQLLDAGQNASNGHLGAGLCSLRELYKRHERLADELGGVELQVVLDRDLRPVFQASESLLQEIAERGELTTDLQDHLLGFGECLSSQLVSAALRDAELDTEHVDARACIVTDKRHSQASPLWDLTAERLQQLARPLAELGRVVVMGGFIAATTDGVPTTLGRGGSDFTAAIVGAALGACRIEIWTDVDGIMTTDPKLCPDAQVIPQMSFHEAGELAHFGAKVLHPSTLIPAMRHQIPVYVLNSRRPHAGGTEIADRARTIHAVSAITAKRNVAAVEIEVLDGFNPDLLREVSQAFHQRGCPVQLLASSQGRVSLVVASTAALLGVSSDLQNVASVRWENHKALVCLVGESIRRQPQVASQIFAAVSDLDVRVVGQGAGERSLSFLVEESKAEETVRRLHKLLFPRPEPMGDWGGDSVAFCQAG